jgi:hypothetical protein
MNNTRTLGIVAIFMAATLVVGVTFTASAYAGDSSTTKIIIKNSQKAIASGIKPNVQNCAENNIDAKIATGR